MSMVCEPLLISKRNGVIVAETASALRFARRAKRKADAGRCPRLPAAVIPLEPHARRSYLILRAILCPGVAMIQLNRDARTAALREKVRAGQRLSFDDGLHLHEHVDLC